jgi:hypothetical protein
MRSVVPVRCRERGSEGLGLRGFVLVFVLFALAWSLYGCAPSGETVAEANRRHSRVLRLNNQAMLDDVDRFMLLDRPSHLTDKRVP